ncbi:hypothetical protein IVB69_11295 [Flavobacterium sp. J49]|uniref:hypothetical protein n=1 Tax=Flavobacterium sp. J49 TaxID=2718534 RepID=UPI0015948B31|nr:hypothetical protein [Flavobacterium sp. J49]MBF6642067.1 hypothetical protein [Flavobacterium sp. J49]NIC03315.1 hypothetical protein [Flavobacterium sp. J49]
MKKITSLVALLLVVTACGVRQTRDMLTSGDYDGAIQNAVEGLRGNKNAKGKQDYVYMLEEAFAKAKERDLRNIEVWFKDANPQNLEKIYETYVQLNARQERIRPILPVRLLKEGREAIFPFDDYSDQIVSSKNALAKYLYDNSKALLANKDKMVVRRAYNDLVYLQNLSPGFKDTDKLIEEARTKGTDYVSVYTKNETNMVIPVRLENDLLDFSTLGLNDKWTVYHSNRIKGITYDYGLVVNFRDIKISPEQIKEKEIQKERLIKVGLKNLLDANGQVVKDSLGNPIKVDDMRTVRATIYEFSQFKACQVTAKVDYIDFNNNQLLQTFPLASEFIFNYMYAKYRGDKRACEQEYYQYFDRRAVPFPSNEQMVYDTGNDLKNKLKEIITRNKFRR